MYNNNIRYWTIVIFYIYHMDGIFMKKNKLLLVISIIIAISILVIYFIVNKPIYGNDENGIIKVISNDDTFKNEY